MILSEKQAQALMNGESVTAACEMDQPLRVEDKVSFITPNRIVWEGEYAEYSTAVPHPVDTEVEIELIKGKMVTLTADPLLSADISQEHVTPLLAVVCTAIVTNVSVVERDGRWVALTTVEKVR